MIYPTPYAPIGTGLRGRVRRLERMNTGFRPGGMPDVPWQFFRLFPFYVEMKTPTSVTVAAGTIRIHGEGNYSVAETTVALTGVTEWVYVSMPWAAPATATVDTQSTEPETDNVTLRWPLVSLAATSGVYYLDKILHIGDINLALPLRG